jgi:hypothetical protein
MANILKEVFMLDFLLTGTRVYGPAKADSDLDIVVRRDDTPSIGKFLAEHNIPMYNTPTQDSYGEAGGFYFKLAGIEVNIIVADNEAEFNSWAEKTEKMKKLLPIKDRKLRLAMFKSNEVVSKSKEVI